jgi:hypothetical protein
MAFFMERRYGNDKKALSVSGLPRATRRPRNDDYDYDHDYGNGK